MSIYVRQVETWVIRWDADDSPSWAKIPPQKRTLLIYMCMFAVNKHVAIHKYMNIQTGENSSWLYIYIYICSIYRRTFHQCSSERAWINTGNIYIYIYNIYIYIYIIHEYTSGRSWLHIYKYINIYIPLQTVNKKAVASSGIWTRR